MNLPSLQRIAKTEKTFEMFFEIYYRLQAFDKWNKVFHYLQKLLHTGMRC